MEQLSRGAVRQLREGMREGAGRAWPPAALAREWEWEPAALAREWISPAIAPAPAEARWSGWSGPAGIERRLVRRADVLWQRLAGDRPMPDARAAAGLLQPPFGAQALWVEAPAPAPASPAIVHAGPALAELTGLAAGPLAPAAGLPPLGRRLAALAGRALELGRRCRFDTDLPGGQPMEGEMVEPGAADCGPDGLNPHYLVRAVALPLAGTRDGGAGRSAVVVASWRKLLSTEETRALHGELAAALDWLNRQCP